MEASSGIKVIKRAAALALVSGAILAGAVGTAEAKPREVNCLALPGVIESSYDMYESYAAEGNVREALWWRRLYVMATDNYDRYCLS